MSSMINVTAGKVPAVVALWCRVSTLRVRSVAAYQDRMALACRICNKTMQYHLTEETAIASKLDTTAKSPSIVKHNLLESMADWQLGKLVHFLGLSTETPWI